MKPRVFLSSTCYDLTDARARLTTFLESYHFDVLNSQRSFGVLPHRSTLEVCLDQVELADYMILIIGNRSGSTLPGSRETITNAEYNRAMQRGIPVIPFVNRKVFGALELYKANPDADFTKIVENVRVFDFINVIASGKKDGWLHQFEDVTEIENTLKDQFAYFLLMFSRYLGRVDGTYSPVEMLVMSNGIFGYADVLASPIRAVPNTGPEPMKVDVR